MKSSENMPRFVTTFDRIEDVMKQISDLEYSIEEGETLENYKKRVENLFRPLISKLEGVKLEWVVPDYSGLPEELRPENIGEQVVHINISESPVRDIINSILSILSVKSKQKK